MERTGEQSGRHSGEVEGWPRPRLPPASSPRHGPARSLPHAGGGLVTRRLLGTLLKGRLRSTGCVGLGRGWSRSL